MGMKLVFELSDEDLEYFAKVFRERQPGSEVSLDRAEIKAATDGLLEEAAARGAPPFIMQKLARLKDLVEMVEDREWRLPEADTQRVLRALAYFADPTDLIPDDLPVMGYLDDAMMVDVAMREVEPEFEAWRDFRAFREAESRRRAAAGKEPGEVSRADWLAARRQELQDRMHTRRKRLLGI